MPFNDLFLKLFHLPIEFLEMQPKALNQMTERKRQLAAGILEQFRNTLGDVVDTFRDDQPKFTEQTADLIGLRRARLHKPLAHPMHGQDRLLLDALDRHKAHAMPTY